jgi:hypothetical protein
MQKMAKVDGGWRMAEYGGVEGAKEMRKGKAVAR